MAEQRLERDDLESRDLPEKPVKRPYSPPSSVQLSGSKEEEYGAAIAAGAVWVIGIGPAWIW
jgi:hypothetical protein